MQLQDARRQNIVTKIIEMFEKHQQKEPWVKGRRSTGSARNHNNFSTIWTKQRSSNFGRILQTSLSWLQFLYGNRDYYCNYGRNLKYKRSPTSTQKANNDSTSILGFVAKKNSTRGAKHGQSERQVKFFKAQEMLKKAIQEKHGSHPTILSRWQEHEGYRRPLAEHNIGDKEVVLYDRIVLERHDYTATRAERLHYAKHWVLRLNADGHQKLLRQQQDFVNALKQCLEMQDALETQQSLRPMRPQHQQRQRQNQQFEHRNGKRVQAHGNVHHLRNGGDFLFLGKNSKKSRRCVNSTPKNTAHTAQHGLFTSAERIARAWLKNCITSLCAWKEFVALAHASYHDYVIFLTHSSFYHDTRTCTAIGTTTRSTQRTPRVLLKSGCDLLFCVARCGEAPAWWPMMDVVRPPVLYECAKDRRLRRLRSEGRLRLHLCRDAARIAAHRGGHDSRIITTHTSTQTDIEFVAPAPSSFRATPALTEYVAPAPVITDFSEPPIPVIEPAPVIKHVSVTPDDTYAAPARLDSAPEIRYISPVIAVFFFFNLRSVNSCLPLTPMKPPPVLVNPKISITLLSLHRCRLSFRKFLRFLSLSGYRNKLWRTSKWFHRSVWKSASTNKLSPRSKSRSPVWWTRKFLSLLLRLHQSLVHFLCRKILLHPCTSKSIRNRSMPSLRTCYTCPSLRPRSSLWKVSRRSLRNVLLSGLKSWSWRLIFLTVWSWLMTFPILKNISTRAPRRPAAIQKMLLMQHLLPWRNLWLEHLPVPVQRFLLLLPCRPLITRNRSLPKRRHKT